MKWIDRTLITSPLYIGLCTTEAQFHKVLKKLKLPRRHWPKFIKNPHSDATVHFLEKTTNGESMAIVCIKKRPKKDIILIHGLLTHEAVHIFQEIKDHIGEGNPSNEFEAYSIQSIAQRLMEAYEDCRGKE